jgi:cytochrome c553
MQATFWKAVAAREAVIAGDLEGAKSAARELAEDDYSALPASWKHWVAQLQQRAGEAVLAPDLTTEAQSVARLALACGDCHAQFRHAEPLREPALEWQDPPEDIDERMLRHEIGVDQLWLGLVRPSEGAWRNGTITLTRAPLAPPQKDGESVDPALAEQIEAIRDLARRARVARSHPERAAIYGELLASCANCHYAVRRGAR